MLGSGPMDEATCGHTSLIPVSAFIEKFGREAELNPFLQKARCSHCRIKNNAESRIVLTGGSGQAMLGTATRQAATGESYAPSTQLLRKH